MLIRLHRLRDRGVPIPKYQFAFKAGLAGDLTIHEERDPVLNRHTRVARLREPSTRAPLPVPMLLDAQLLELTRERMILSGIERLVAPVILRVEDMAQTWVCLFETCKDA